MKWQKELGLLNSLLRVVDSLARLAERADESRKERGSEPESQGARGAPLKSLGQRARDAVELVEGEDHVWRERKVAAEGESREL